MTLHFVREIPYLQWTPPSSSRPAGGAEKLRIANLTPALAGCASLQITSECAIKILSEAEACLRKDPNVLDVPAPVTIVGDIHGQV